MPLAAASLARPARAAPAVAPPAGSLPALTGIRAVGCLWVILSHIALTYRPAMAPWLLRFVQPGYLGVDLFFILSGFILARVHPNLHLGLRPVAAFALKRLFRIYPLSTAIMLFMAADAWRHGWLGTPWYEPRLFGPVLLMIEPYFSHPPLVGWLATNWSVGIELLCYAAFPFGLACLRAVPRWGRLALLAALLAAEAWTQWHHLGAFYGPGAILRGLCGFWLGAVCAALAIGRPARRAVALASLLCLAGTLALLQAGVLWPVPLCMAGLITAVSFECDVVAALLGTRVFVWLGEVSYSLYLVHGVLLGSYGWRWLEAIRLHLRDPLATAAWATLTAGVLLGVSAATYYGIERPWRSFGSRLARRVR